MMKKQTIGIASAVVLKNSDSKNLDYYSTLANSNVNIIIMVKYPARGCTECSLIYVQTRMSALPV